MGIIKQRNTHTHHSCLLRCTLIIIKDLVNVYIEDTHDDKLVSEETALQFNTRVQARAAQAVPTIIEPVPSNPPQDLTKKFVEYPTVTESAMPSQSAHASTVTRATNKIVIHNNFTDFSELAIARALLKHSVEFI